MPPSRPPHSDPPLPDLEGGDVVLVVAGEPHLALHMVDALAECGHAVVGPVERAASAMIIAGQAPVTRAIIYDRLAGRRGGRELAEALRANFGIDALVIEHEDQQPGEGPPES